MMALSLTVFQNDLNTMYIVYSANLSFEKSVSISNFKALQKVFHIVNKYTAAYMFDVYLHIFIKLKLSFFVLKTKNKVS